MAKAPTVEALREIETTYGIKGTAEALHKAMDSMTPSGAGLEANRIMNGHGIENIRSPDAWRHYWLDTVAMYVNMGDTYSATLLYDVYRDEWLVTSYGDWVEKCEEEKRYTFE